MPVNHLVLFHFKADVTTASIETIDGNMRGLKEACVREDTGKPYIKSLTGGKDMSIEGLQNGLQYAYVVQFETKQDRDYYVKQDKAHISFATSLGPVLEKAVVVDYEF